MTKSSREAERENVRVALIGYGLAGSVFHAPLISCTDGMKIAAIVTGNPARKEAASAAFPDSDIFSNVDEIWQRADQFDLVVIASPNKTHAPLAMAALEVGLNVVVDKPMATSAEECNRIVTASRESGKLLSIFHNRRWDGDFMTVQLLVRSNALGAANRLESRFDRWRPAPKPGSWREQGSLDEGAGLLFDLGSHLIDQALTLFGKPITVYAETEVRRESVQSDDDSFVALTFPGGVHAHLWMSAVVRKLAPRFRVAGMLGTFEKYGLDPQEDALRAGRRPTSANWGAEPSECWGTISSEREGLHYEGRVETLNGDYPAFYKQMHDAIVNGAPVPVDPADAVLTLRVIEAARKSAEERCVVSLEHDPVVL